MDKPIKEIKCNSCDQWTDGNKDFCTHCNHSFYAVHHQEIEERKKTELRPIDIPIIKVSESDPIVLKVVKYIIRFHQIVFYSIVSYIAWAMVWVAG